MHSQSELSGGQILQKIYIRGEDGALLTIPETYVILENNNEIVGQEACEFDGNSELGEVHHPSQATVVHIIEETDSRPTDEDLTSLNWLQDINVVNGIPLQSKGATVTSRTPSVVRSKQVTLNPLNCNGQLSEPCSETESSCDGSNLSCSEINLPLDLNCSLQTEASSSNVVLSKPPHSFSTLIFLAIESSPIKAMPVRDIYAWITQHFPYYRYAPAGWKNSVRHNLSLSKSFCKVQQYPGVGKGSLWKVDPLHRPQLIQSLRKIPDISADQLQQIISYNSENSLKASAIDSQAALDENELQDPLSSTASSSSSCSPYSHRSNVPDPNLFPFLSRRLAVSSANESATSKATLSQPRADVDAATAMLALRQEFFLSSSSHFPPMKCYSPRRSCDQEADQSVVANDSFIHEIQEEVEIRSTTQPSPVEEDHTYSFCPRPYKGRPVHRTTQNKPELIRGETTSFGDDNLATTSQQILKCEASSYEDRETLESANALLGLAGIKRDYETTKHPVVEKSRSRATYAKKRAKIPARRQRGKGRGK